MKIRQVNPRDFETYRHKKYRNSNHHTFLKRYEKVVKIYFQIQNFKRFIALQIVMRISIDENTEICNF
jgi:pantothenate kinase-related protein Tda10